MNARLFRDFSECETLCSPRRCTPVHIPRRPQHAPTRLPRRHPTTSPSPTTSPTEPSQLSTHRSTPVSVPMPAAEQEAYTTHKAWTVVGLRWSDCGDRRGVRYSAQSRTQHPTLEATPRTSSTPNRRCRSWQLLRSRRRQRGGEAASRGSRRRRGAGALASPHRRSSAPAAKPHVARAPPRPRLQQTWIVHGKAVLVVCYTLHLYPCLFVYN